MVTVPGRNIAAAETAQIGRNYAAMVNKKIDLRLPNGVIQWKTMHQQQRITLFAAGIDRQLHIADLNVFHGFSDFSLWLFSNCALNFSSARLICIVCGSSSAACA